MIYIRLLLLSALVAFAIRCGTIPPTPARTVDVSHSSAQEVIPEATQQLLDALPHDASVWQRYLSEQAIYVSEAGDVVSKRELLEGFAPFPEGLTGSIRVNTVRLTTHGDVAIHVFDAHETQTIYGQAIQVN